MRSRSWSELLPVALAAAVEGIWVGALAAAISGASGPALMAFVAVVVFVAALLARRVAGGAAAGLFGCNGGDPVGEQPERIAAPGLQRHGTRHHFAIVRELRFAANQGLKRVFRDAVEIIFRNGGTGAFAFQKARHVAQIFAAQRVGAIFGMALEKNKAAAALAHEQVHRPIGEARQYLVIVRREIAFQKTVLA